MAAAGALKFLASPILAAPLSCTGGRGRGCGKSDAGWTGTCRAWAAQGSPSALRLEYSAARARRAAIHGAAGSAECISAAPSWRTAHRPAFRLASGVRHVRYSQARQRPVTLAGIPLYRLRDETKHFKFIGTTGTGKSTAIQEVLGSALARGDRAVIADPRRRLPQAALRQRARRRSPQPLRPTIREMGFVREIKNAYDVDQLARSLIPDQDAAERSWRGYARTFFSAVTRQAHEGGISDLGELYRLLVVADAAELRTLVKGTPAQPFLEEHNSRMFDSIRSVTSSAVAALDYVGQQRGRGFSIRDWVNDETAGVLFIPYKAGQIAALRSTISAWMRLAIFEAMNRDQPEVASCRAESGENAPVVRGGRARCARADRRAQGCPGATAKVRRPLRPGIPVDRPGFRHLRPERSPHDHRKLRQHADPPLLRQRGRRHGALRLPADRRA